MKKYVIYGLIGITLAVTFYPMFFWMIERFLEADSYYTHGFLIPLITAYFVWRKWTEIVQLPLRPSWMGLPVMLTGLLVHFVGGLVFQVGFFSGIAFVIVLFGMSLFLLGRPMTRVLAFPLLFLGFMVPLPKVLLIGITFKMKMLAAYLAAALVAHLPVAIKSAGSMIYLPNGVLTVGNACSGINSLISLLTLSLIFAYVTDASFWKRSLFVFFALPVALAANVARIVFLILAAYVYGTETATRGILHFGAGMTLWIVALLLLGGIWRMTNWRLE